MEPVPLGRCDAPALLESARLSALRRPVRDSGPLRSRLRGGAGRPLPSAVSVRAPLARTVQRESGPRGVTLGESPLFLLDAEPAPGLGRLAVPPRRRGLRLAYSRPLRRAFPP